jgi:hypothetical protein
MTLINYEKLEEHIHQVEEIMEVFDHTEQQLLLQSLVERLQKRKQQSMQSDLIQASLTPENLQQTLNALKNTEVKEDKE